MRHRFSSTFVVCFTQTMLCYLFASEATHTLPCQPLGGAVVAIITDFPFEAHEFPILGLRLFLFLSPKCIEAGVYRLLLKNKASRAWHV